MFSSLSVCLSVCPLDYSRSYEWILMKFFRGVGREPWNNQCDSGGDSDHNPDAGTF